MSIPTSDPTPGSPQQLPSEEGYQPVRRDAGDPIAPEPAVPAPQPIGITMQPPRRGLPVPVDYDNEASADEPDDGEAAEAAPETATEDPSETESAADTPDQVDPSDAESIPPADAAAEPDPTDQSAEAGAEDPAIEVPAEEDPAPESPYARPTDAEVAAAAERRRSAGEPDPRHAVGELITKLNVPSVPRATRGWRALLNLAPSDKEKAELADLDALRRTFDRPITIMVANPKGGVGKTPVTLLLSAAFGTARGGGVVAWDNNELRGTMPERSVSEHRHNVRDLLAESESLRNSTAGFTDVARLLNHQTSGNFHTLGSAQAAGQSISRADFEVTHEILRRFFEIIVVDTGNNEAASNWLAAAETADCLVVPTKWRKDSLIPAARMLESLTEVNARLLEHTLIVATNAPAEAQKESRKTAGKWFGSRHPVLEIPTDPHIAEGDVLNYERLHPATRRATQEVAAAIIKLLDR